MILMTLMHQKGSGDIWGMTEKEKELLKMFRNLDIYEQKIIIGKISELILNKKKEKLILVGIKK